jgi:hypothetical protein
MNLHNYLFGVKELEIACYQQEQLCQRMRYIVQQEQNPVCRQKDTYHGPDIFDEIMDNGWIVGVSAFLGFILGCILMMFFPKILDKIFTESIADFFPFWAAIAGGILSLVILIICAKNEINQKRKAVEIENRKIDQYNAQLRNKMPIRVENAQKQLSRANALLQSTRQVLQQYYSRGIIHLKYQHNLVAIAMFYDYIDTGRCSALEGYAGAYNLYESEVRMNMILSKLDDIVNRLDDISSAQWQLSQELRNGQQQVNRLCNSVQNSLDNISSNTESAAYYSRISAINTTYLAWIKKH